MSDYSTDYLIVVALSFLFSGFAGIARGMITFGDGIVFHILWHFAVAVAPGVMHQNRLGDDDFLIGTMLLSFRQAVVQPYFFLLARKYLREKFVLRQLPLYLLAYLGGTVVVMRYSRLAAVHIAAAAVFGLAAAVITAVQLRRLYVSARAERQRSERRLLLTDDMDRDDDRDAEEEADPRRSYAGANLDGGRSTLRRSLLPKGMQDHGCDDGDDDAAMDVASLADWMPTRGQIAGGVVATIVAGFCGGLAAVSGPPMMIFQLGFGIPADVVRGVVPGLDATACVARFLYVLFTGGFKLDLWLVYAAVVVGGCVGQAIGSACYGVISAAHANFAICWFVALAAIALGELPAWALFGAGGLCAVTCVAFPFAFPRPKPDDVLPV
jgi:hypothetical protein